MANNLKPNSKKIENVLIVYRQGTTKARKVAIELVSWLKAKGIDTYGTQDQNWPEDMNITVNSNLDTIDLVVVLGGDGTYLEAVRHLQGRKVPILGVNMGSLGFLTETRLETLYENLELTLAGKMEMRPRSMIQVTTQQENKVITQRTALNDIVIERGGGGHMITLSTYCENRHVCDYKADGLIIATPTGSTAYNLASGGPILHPEVRSLVVTPICPHSLTNRPIIFPDDKILTFKIKKGRHDAVLTVDGQFVCNLTHLDEVSVRRDACDHFVLRRPSHNYFDLLREKLNFGSRAVF
jgi:NAD+ kinase